MADPALLQVGGLSIGGIETCIDIPELKLCLDVGRCPQWAVARSTVLITHAHLDHLGGLASHVGTRAMLGMAPARYVLASDEIGRVAGLLDAWRALDRSPLPAELVPLDVGQELELARDWRVRPFRSVHRIACQGYALWRCRRGLRPEFRGLPQAELRRLASEQGVSLSAEHWVPELAFPGDTRIEVVEREEVVRKARVLVLECTFLDDRVDLARVRESGHVHLDQIVERAELFENEHVILTHFSTRYAPDQVRAILAARLPPGLRERVTPLL